MKTLVFRKALGAIALPGLLCAMGLPVRAAQSNEELAKAAQNPVANLISVPFQDNINFNVGPEFGPNWTWRLQAQLMFPK